MKYIYITILFSLIISTSYAQDIVKGNVVDSRGVALIGAHVVEKGTTNGVSTDLEGNFSITVPNNAILVVSYVGFTNQEVSVEGQKNLTIQLTRDEKLDEVVVTGNRLKARTILDSPVPIDNIKVEELTITGKPTFERMLTFAVPSFNAQNQAISDATAHYDPADLRGLGPSRTLVLVNGKRKNQSAQVYLNRTPGKGEVGIDLKSIPVASIARIEVLRDGASAQYGSDAIAGVINIVLKDNIDFSTFNASTGITSEGDGFNYNLEYNSGFKFGQGGIVNLTLSHYQQEFTNRAGSPGVSDLPDDRRPNELKWAQENPQLGMKVGQPDITKNDILANIEHPIGENGRFYTFHSYTKRYGRSFAYYRAPYWRRGVADAGFITPSDQFIGYHPSFEADITDNMNVAGVDFDLFEDLTMDISFTNGGNHVFYTVNNSVNRDYLKDNGWSPRSFNPGGYSFRNYIGNLDFTYNLDENLGISFGLEAKRENFESHEGNPMSYYKGGSDSFAGIKPAEVVDENRDSFAGYVGADYNLTEEFLIGAAMRYEDFSDFGDNFSWKINSRYKLGNLGAIRGSMSTGFRAPSLHQRHLTNSQYIIVPGSSEPLLQGTLSNNHPALVGLGVPSLFAETSVNYSFGGTMKLSDNLSASLDGYLINVNDRVLFSSQIATLDGNLDGSDAVEQILIDNNVVAVQFFINAGDTETKGLDFVLTYDNLELGSKALANVVLAANFNETTIDAITTPSKLSEGGYNIFDRQEQGLIINSRPKSKILLGFNMELPKATLAFNNTLFGKVTVTHPEGSTTAIDQDLAPRLSSDLNFKYKLSGNVELTGFINNIFDVYPEKTDPNTETSQAGTRFIYSSEVQQMGQLGRNYSIGLSYTF